MSNPFLASVKNYTVPFKNGKKNKTHSVINDLKKGGFFLNFFLTWQQGYQKMRLESLNMFHLVRFLGIPKFVSF